MNRNPKFGSNILQSFVTFMNDTGNIRFGVEGTKLFYEAGETKVYITNDDGNVTASGIADLSVSTAKLVDLAVTAAKLGTDAVTTSKILNANVTAEKLAASLDLSGKTLSNLAIESGTPVNAVASVGTLTVSGDMLEDEEIVINGRTYTASSDASFSGDVRIDISAGATAATGTITFAGTVDDGEDVTINGRVYEFDTDASISGDVAVDISAGTKVQATGTLTIASTVIDGETVTIGDETYEFNSVGGYGDGNIEVDISGSTKTQAVGTLTLTGVFVEGEFFRIGNEVYEIDANGSVSGGNIAVDVSAFMTASQGTLTLGGAIPSNNEAITVGSQTYTWKTTLTGAADEIKIGSTVDDCIDNFTYAINAGIGEGTLYGTGTTANALVTAAKTGGTTSVLTSIIWGTVGDATATTETMVDGANIFDAGTLGTTTAGVDCTAANADGVMITAFTNGTALAITASQGGGTTVVFTATAAGVLDGSPGNAIISDGTMANGSFGTAYLIGGTDATANEASAALHSSFTANSALDITSTDGTGSVDFDADAAGALDGSLGNAVATTEVMANGSFAQVTLTGASDATANEAATALTSAIVGDGSKEVNGADGTGNVVVTAIEEGTGPNSWTTTETCANGSWGAGTLGSGSDIGAADAVTAIALAITNDGSAEVTAVDGAADTVVMTAKIKGTSGDAITTTTDMSNGAFGQGTLGDTVAGVDGTVGTVRKVLADATSLFYATAANTIADANWKKIDWTSL
jgi:hypothetical protein